MTLKELKRLALIEQEEIRQASVLVNGKTAYEIFDSESGAQVSFSLWTKSGLIKRYMGNENE